MTPSHVPTALVLQGVALVCLVWSLFIYVVQIIGIFQM